MDSPWRKFEDKDGFPYYINEDIKLQQWSHPKFADIRQRLDGCNYVKYSMYRVALKLRVLQNALFSEYFLTIYCTIATKIEACYTIYLPTSDTVMLPLFLYS
nr:unnamed protein product [Callosobruchus chinensis]